MCEPCDRVRPPYCEFQRPGCTCAAPTPRDINNYYNRHHLRDEPDPCRCKGGCYCPEDCCCARHNMNGRYVETRACCDYDDECCICGGSISGSRGGGGGGGGGCCPTRSSPPRSGSKCCGPRGFNRRHHDSDRCCAPTPCCRPPPRCCTPPEEECCPPCCPPYKPPKRKPICYPPIKCCETDECGQSPPERICYTPKQIPRNPRYCSCGSANPCECDLEMRRRAALCETAPCCRRCGRKVYAAEKILGAGGAFHSSCYSCYCCHKPLEVTNVFENQGEIYCKQCYTRYFGVCGYGYGNKCSCKECVNN